MQIWLGAPPIESDSMPRHKLEFEDGIVIDLEGEDWALAAALVAGLEPDWYPNPRAKALIANVRKQVGLD